MKFDILTLFPGMFVGPFDESIISRAKDKQLIDISLHNIRDWAVDRHQTVDDAPYGGGAGMVMKAEPLAAAICAVKALRPSSAVLLTSPQGRRLTHVSAELLERAIGEEKSRSTLKNHSLATDLTAREVNAQRTEADRDFH